MSRSRTERLLLTADGVLDADGRAWPQFSDWCVAHAGARVALLADAEHVHSLLLPEDLPLDGDDALHGYARLQFSHYFGPAAQQWPLASWPRGVCAWAAGDLATLHATAAASRVRIASLRPSWTLAPTQDGDWAVIDGDGLLTWLRRRDGRLIELQQRHVGDEWLQELDGAHVVHARDLLGAPAAKGGPDFIAQPSRLRPLAWGWAAVAAAACALVAVQAQGLREESRRLAEQAAVLDRTARPVPAAKATAAGAATLGRAWAAARQLDVDWAERWTGLERALPPGLQLAALDLDGRTLRLEGQAQDADAVTRLADRLALQAAPGEEVVLTRLQRPDTPADAVQLRFEIVRRATGPAR